MHDPIMPARSVQISLDEALLARIDKRPDAKRAGRSAFIRKAIELYLELERRREIDKAYARGYGPGTPDPAEDFADLLRGQQWPEK